MERPSARYESLLATLGIVCLVLILSHFILPVYEVQFMELDPSLSHFGDKEQVSNVACVVYTLLILFIVLPAYIIYSPTASKLTNYLGMKSSNSHATNQQITLLLWHLLGISLALLSTQACTEVLKGLVGRPRPNAFYLCNYAGFRDAVKSNDYSTYLAAVKPNAIGNQDKCLDKNATKEAFLSFPSGHASFAFAAMVYCTFLLRGLLSVQSQVYCSVNTLVSYLPIAFACWIAITRVQDNFHHEDDVAIGGAIGVICAIGSIQTVSQYISMDSERNGVVSSSNSTNIRGEESREQDEDPLLPL